ncbi:hypothetical protein QQ008_03330 [Fulvivirgaceae bacterium BMA10]|uniref:Uncharacterized protein n=1 Tax=Splendidivirga corallicola TaxID=3051826 RepID=A0ABT8KJC5_9BACT|nr:hypothetical protein [Fulvivirgaceae bacterium BMA10]
MKKEIKKRLLYSATYSGRNQVNTEHIQSKNLRKIPEGIVDDSRGVMRMFLIKI